MPVFMPARAPAVRFTPARFAGQAGESGMRDKGMLLAAAGASVAAMALGASAQAASVQIGGSGKTYASIAVQCTVDPSSGSLTPSIEAGLFNPKRGASAAVCSTAAR